MNRFTLQTTAMSFLISQEVNGFWEPLPLAGIVVGCSGEEGLSDLLSVRLRAARERVSLRSSKTVGKYGEDERGEDEGGGVARPELSEAKEELGNTDLVSVSGVAELHW
jgi:hypothetical protein